MKIGEFAQSHGLSIDTIRHYIDMKLLIPIKIGAHYEFDNSCEEELVLLLKIKDSGFKLSEIKSVFSFMRIGRMTNYRQSEFYRDLFRKRLDIIEKEISKLNTNKEKLKKMIMDIESFVNEKSYC